MSWTFQSEPKESHLRFEIYNSIDDLDANAWNSIVASHNLFLTIPYLTSLEESLNSSISFKYVVFFK